MPPIWLDTGGRLTYWCVLYCFLSFGVVISPDVAGFLLCHVWVPGSPYTAWMIGPLLVGGLLFVTLALATRPRDAEWLVLAWVMWFGLSAGLVVYALRP
jgi:hypothetical protein